MSSEAKVYAGKRLKQLRQALEYNQDEMAERFGVSQSYYSSVEGGKKPLTGKMLAIVMKEWPDKWALESENIGSKIYPIENKMSYKGRFVERKIGVLRKEVFEAGLSPENKKLVSALRELPELVEMLSTFIKIIDLDNLEKISSIGAAWSDDPNLIIPEAIGDFDNDAYELNMNALLKYLAKHRGSIITLNSDLYRFFMHVSTLNRFGWLKLPKR